MLLNNIYKKRIFIDDKGLSQNYNIYDLIATKFN